MLPRRPSQRTLEELAATFRGVVVTGPRQAGKTTLVRATFPGRPYVSLEDPDESRFARDDPRGFLARFPDGAILDEVQRTPDLLSYLQRIFDEDQRPGLFILTGSQHFGLISGIRQSLAGRVALLHLLPLSSGELARAAQLPANLDEVLWRGGYPTLHDSNVDPIKWLDNYITTYIERDVRGILDVRNLATFESFVRLCAGHTAQLVHLSKLGNETGITHPTANAWIDILEASYVVFRLPPFHASFIKRVTKTPKLYFYDTGLACRLLGISSPQQLVTHPMRGALFENWVITEVMKERHGRGFESVAHFWRTTRGDEIDIVLDRQPAPIPIECKSGATVLDRWWNSIDAWRRIAAESSAEPWLVYGGDASYRRREVNVVGWADLWRQLDDDAVSGP